MTGKLIARLPAVGVTEHSILFLKAPPGEELTVLDERTGEEVLVLPPMHTATFVTDRISALDGSEKGCDWHRSS